MTGPFPKWPSGNKPVIYGGNTGMLPVDLKKDKQKLRDSERKKKEQKKQEDAEE